MDVARPGDRRDYLELMSEPDPLHAISVPQPEFSEAQAKVVLAEKFGLQGELRSLVSERDQNFRVVTTDGEQFVFKIANRAEPGESTDFQIKALLHIEQAECEVPTPRIWRAIDGADSTTIADGDSIYVCRVVSFLPGDLLSDIRTTPELAQHFGECVARLDIALADFEHVGQAQSLLWDLQRASQLREILHHIEDDALRGAASEGLDDFDKHVVPALPRLRRQVIHGDLNGDNVLADANRIVGVIDFGDMMNAPLVMEVAVASAYLRPEETEPEALALIGPFIGAFHSVLPLANDEIGLLYDLIRARLVATISILSWRAATRGADDEYSSQNLSGESDAAAFLLRLTALGHDEFERRIRKHL